MSSPDSGPGALRSVQLDALSVAMQAQAGSVDAFTVEMLQEKARSLLPPGDGLRRAIDLFATLLERDGAGRATLRALAEDLRDAVEAAGR